MTVRGKKPSRRYSREQAQEDRSEGQFKERLAEVGWPCDRIGRDLGEDLHVRIYDGGATTGLSFDVQLKSTANSAALRRKRSEALAYKLEVKDLDQHWELSTKLVVLVVWDVEKQTGWWRSVPEIIKDLDATMKGWRKQNTVTATVPLKNGMDKDGLTRLRSTVGDFSLPLVPDAKTFEFSMTFPSTEEGRRGAKALQEAIDTGESINFVGKALPHFEMPQWHRRIYGSDAQPEAISFTPKPTDRPFPVRIEVESSEGTAAYPYVDLRLVKAGRKRRVMTNEGQKLPFLFTLEIASPKGSLTFKERRVGKDVYETKEAAAFALAVRARDCAIRIINLASGKPVAAFKSSKSTPEGTLEQLRRWHSFTDKLCFIQQRVKKHGAFSIKDDLTPDDLMTANELFRIFRDGKIERTIDITFTVRPSSREAIRADVASGDGPVHIHLEGGKASLLGVDIPLGTVKQTITARERFLEVFLPAAAKANATGVAERVQLGDVRVVEEYLDWLPEKPSWDAMYDALDRLSMNPAHRDGYFTRADARAAGASDTVFEAILREQKVEPIGSDVFHLVQFPRSDHEELLSLWLQTDRLGVLSHDTALVLNDLSDILPRRRHITVPPGWDPSDRKLDANVVLHHAEIGEDEIRWLGPVPYTAPLRTLRDCIASHLSPDLIEQAIADGLRRGMFSEAELPPTAHRGAA